MSISWIIGVRTIATKQLSGIPSRSATKGRSYIVHVQNVKNLRAVGYVTKYLTKDVAHDRRGMREELRELLTYHVDEQGHIAQECSLETVQVMSKARRIRYTRHFFPASTADLRLRLFAGLGDANEIAIDQAVVPDVEDASDLGDEQEPQAVKASWVLYEHDEFSGDIDVYRERRQAALVESLTDLRAGKLMYSRRVLSVWDYQRKQTCANETNGKP